MSKQLYEEALADVKQVKKVAEDNALRTLTDAVRPRIRDFIDRVILDEHGLEDGEPDGDEYGEPGAPPPAGELITDTGGEVEEVPAGSVSAAGPMAGGTDAMPASGITPPDAEGKITIDLDALCGGNAPVSGMPSVNPGPAVAPPMFGEPVPRPEEAEYEISMESLDSLKPILSAAKKNAKPISAKGIRAMLGEVIKRVKQFRDAGEAVRATSSYGKHIALMVSHVEDMYDYVQESVSDPATKSSYETVLENSFKVLTKLQESTTMSQKTQKGRVNEADLTLKLTGLPDEVEDSLDAVGVDLITGEEDEEGLDAMGGEEGGDEAGLGGLDMGGEQGQEDQQMENRELSDDTIVEIDEKMLRREIARMRSLREETKPAAWGDGPGGANILDDFGGGKDEGDPATDQEIADLSPAKASHPLGEADEDLDEQQEDMDEQDQDMDQGYDQMDEQDQDMDQGVHAPKDMAMEEADQDLDQVGDQRTRDDFGGSATSVPSKDKSNPASRHGEAVRRLGFEKKLQERAKARASALKKEAARARAAKNGKRLVEVKKEYAVVAQRFNESLARTKKLTQIKALAAKKLQEARSNSAAARPADGQADSTLRKKLAETNLFNAKLLFTNKLLQTESLSAKQKAQVIKQLDEAQTVREAKLIYQSLIRTLAAPANLREGTDRRVLGSASRATRPASTQTLNEGADVERWAQLAGIAKR
jgi:hypothetical protein